MTYFWLIVAAIFTAIAVERTIDVFIAVRRGYFTWKFGGWFILSCWLPVIVVVVFTTF